MKISVQQSADKEELIFCFRVNRKKLEEIKRKTKDIYVYRDSKSHIEILPLRYRRDFSYSDADGTFVYYFGKSRSFLREP